MQPTKGRPHKVNKTLTLHPSSLRVKSFLIPLGDSSTHTSNIFIKIFKGDNRVQVIVGFTTRGCEVER